MVVIISYDLNQRSVIHPSPTSTPWHHTAGCDNDVCHSRLHGCMHRTSASAIYFSYSSSIYSNAVVTTATRLLCDRCATSVRLRFNARARQHMP